MSRLIALCLLHQVAASWDQVGADIDGELDSQFGISVALNADGQYLAVGAISYNTGSFVGGHVRIFKNIDGAWNQVGADIDSQSESEQFGFAVAMSADGSRVIGGGSRAAGVARVYHYGSGLWSQVGSDLTGSGATNYFGGAVAMSADGLIIAVAARYHDSNAGRVQVFEEIGANWVQKGNNLDGAAASDFGRAVALSADGLKVAVGATASNAFFGSVQVYAFINEGWMQMGGDLVGQTEWETFGRSVSLSASGLHLACGAAAFDTDANNNAGGVKVYEFAGDSWTQLGTTIMGEGANDNLGTSVSISDDGSSVACGAPYNAVNVGHGRVYQYTDGAWVKTGQDFDGEAAGDNAGVSVALSGDGSYVAIGAPANDGNGNSAGHARVFKRPEPAPTTPAPTPTTPAPTPTTPAPTPTTAPPVFMGAAVSTFRIDAVLPLVACMAVFVVQD